ncbi:MAG: tyrosine-type recombinase/integrase [Blastocatellia bacterium]
MKIEKYFDKQLKQNCWRINVTINGRRHRQGKFTSKSQAERFIADLRAQALTYRYGVARREENVSINDLLDRLAEQVTRPTQRVVIQLFRDAVEGDKPTQSLSRVDMAKFKATCDERNFQPATIAQYRAVLYAMLNRAGELFESLENWQPPKFPRIEKAESRSRVLSRDELQLLLACWGRQNCFHQESEKGRGYRLALYDIARMMLLTAARREEIEAITVEQIDWREGWINLKSGKVRRSHLIPLSDSARALLAARKHRQPMFGDFGTNMHYTLKRVGREAGIPYGQQTATGWAMHDVRRTAATLIESGGIPYSAVSAMLGHKRRDMTAIYTLADRQHLRTAAQLLEDYCLQNFDGFLADLKGKEISQMENLTAKAQ